MNSGDVGFTAFEEVKFKKNLLGTVGTLLFNPA